MLLLQTGAKLQMKPGAVLHFNNNSVKMTYQAERGILIVQITNKILRFEYRKSVTEQEFKWHFRGMYILNHFNEL